MPTQTSIDSYIATRKEGKVGKRQREIMDLLERVNEPLNNRMIAELLGLPINSTTPRIFELREKGRVESAGTQHDSVTNRNTIFWRVREE